MSIVFKMILCFRIGEIVYSNGIKYRYVDCQSYGFQKACIVDNCTNYKSNSNYSDMCRRHFTISGLENIRKIRLINHAPGNQLCSNLTCLTCDLYLETGDVFKSTSTQKTYEIEEHVTCLAKNLVYLLTCRDCLVQYVGMTTLEFRARINHHRNMAREAMQTHLSMSKLCTSFKAQIIELVNPDNGINLLLEKERFWITELKPQLNETHTKTYKTSLVQLENEMTE